MSVRRTGAGIIPARAGFTITVNQDLLKRADHPRSRGVYPYQVAAIVSYQGSSPLARGLLTLGTVYFPHMRIIPARAGFTITVNQDLLKRADHPRSRGVYDAP